MATTKPFSYAETIALYPGEAADCYRFYGEPVTVLTWIDGRVELIPGTPAEVADELAEWAEYEGFSTRFAVRPATARDVDAYGE